MEEEENNLVPRLRSVTAPKAWGVSRPLHLGPWFRLRE